MINLLPVVLFASCAVLLDVISCRIVDQGQVANGPTTFEQMLMRNFTADRSLASIVDRPRQQQANLHWTPVRDFKPPFEKLISTLLTGPKHQDHKMVPQASNTVQQHAQPCAKNAPPANSTRGNGHLDRQMESAATHVNIDRLNNATSAQSTGEEHEDNEIEQDGDSDDDADNDEPTAQNSTKTGLDQMDSHESVSLESSIVPPSLGGSDNEDADEADEQLSPSSSSLPAPSEHQDSQEPSAAAESEAAAADESAERSEQEAAEAAEAEAADRSALDEQQQAQRQIILAQAQSEAKAIKEQQEALMRQQQLQQQMLLRRHQNDLQSNPSSLQTLPGDKRRGGADQHHHSAPSKQQQRKQQQQQAEHNRRQQQSYKQRWAALDTRQHQQQQAPPTNSDIQFSDQLESTSNGREGGNNRFTDSDSHLRQNDNHNDDINGGNNNGLADQLEAPNVASQGSRNDEMGVDYSIRKPVFDFDAQQQQILPQQIPRPMSSSDLLSAAQHNYGAHYGSLHGHHKGHYYQFAESHKKGQFDSGFKRGGKKFQISGHSSQHKSHAEGHVKWSGKKGKGMQYWDFKHKDKKGGHGHYGYY